MLIDWSRTTYYLLRGAHCLNTSLRAQLHAATLYWQVGGQCHVKEIPFWTFMESPLLTYFSAQHPSLPVPLFPRYSQSSLRTSAAPSLSLSPDMQVTIYFLPQLYIFTCYPAARSAIGLDVLAAVRLPAGESAPVSLLLPSCA